MILFWGLTLGFVGKVLIAASVIIVHGKITKEKRVDGIVLMEMHREKYIAIGGVVLMAVGFVLELAAYGFVPNIF